MPTRWVGDLTYGDVFRRANTSSPLLFEVADIPTLKSSFESYEVEASRALRPGSSCLRDYVLVLALVQRAGRQGAFGAAQRGIHGQGAD